MKKIILFLVAVSVVSPAYSLAFSLNKLQVSDFNAKTAVVPAPSAPVKAETQVSQDLVNKFNQIKNDIWRLESDTTWLRNDINRLEAEARSIEQGSQNAFFSNDLRSMARSMSDWSNRAQRLSMSVKQLLPLAVKDKKLNDLARDIQWDARDLYNRFQFDIQNAAQQLEWTVRRIDTDLVGYDAQWQASDISSQARDLQWKTRDLQWDVQTLVSKTQP
ncbi:MAG: hypothetical protein COT18_12450 [Elusimicrobia bacterium CG08_land_8_20_14_0_20_59_10]|nr:MAG: hypothetical protein COT18_12450 [Elusimicrobia bacterium CG08_land_8_20_14_0_20_59_10]